MARQLFPIISTPDVARALAFYRDLLGGSVSYEYPGPDGNAVYVGLDLGASHIGIGLDADGRVPLDAKRPIGLWVYVDDCDATVARMRGAGFSITQEPADQPWGERVARVLDPDGNEVIIGARGNSESA